MKANEGDISVRDVIRMNAKQAERGRLTLFLGAASGAGKTWAMLTAARQKREAGTEVMFGFIQDEPHPATRELARELGYSPLPLRTVGYRGRQEREMDTEAVIQRRPGLVLIDRLEHINAPGSHKPKRYLDVEDILRQGMDVYATLNIQHVESLNDLVAQITGVRMEETVPDTFLEQADRIQVVDIPAEDMIGRVKISAAAPDQDGEERRFYRAGNINALREMAFRYAAQRIDSQLEQYMHTKDIAGPWPVSEKVMVCVSASPFSAQLLRIGRQMAASLKSDWLAVYVQTPQGLPRSESRQNQLARNLQLAEELGAEVVSVTGSSIADELSALARQRNVKQIIIGKPNRSRLADWLRSSVVEQLIQSSPGASVHVIPGESKGTAAQDDPAHSQRPRSLKPYGWITLLVAVLAVILHVFGLAFDLVNISLMFLAPVLFSAVYWGMWPSFYAAALGVLAFDFFFVPPYFSFTVEDLRYLVSFAVFLAVAALTASLASRLRQQVHFAKQREADTASLYALSRQLTAVTDLPSLLNNIAGQVSGTLRTEVAIFLPDGRDEPEFSVSSPASSGWGRKEAEWAIAKWVYRHGEKAGKGSNTLSQASGLYIPLAAEERVYGVLAVNLAGREAGLAPEQLRLLEALGGLAASAIDRVKLAEQAEVARLTAESEKLRTALLDSVSHELRTPLAAIIGSVTGLMEGDEAFTRQDRLELLSTVRDGALRMNRLVTNLLGMVKLESGMLKLHQKWCDIEDILSVVLSQVKDFQEHRSIRLSLPNPAPYILGDDVLLEQMLVNIVSNSIKYSPDYSEIVISFRQEKDRLLLSVLDAGPGIPAADRERIFDKFYRAGSTRHLPGTGLGLAICKGIAELHGGTIAALPGPSGKGTEMMVTLPAADASGLEKLDHGVMEHGQND